MIPVVTPEEMAAIDAAGPEPVEVLVGRAGAAVARAARRRMGGTYGRRVTVVAGKGNNGADGREAARRLARWGARTTVVDADGPAPLPGSDLVLDAAYGTGLRGSWEPPDTGGTPVLAVDVPSGLDGMTGEAHGRVLRAETTVTFAALKPGLLLAEGPGLAGEVEVADIGLDVSSARAHVVTDADVAAWIPARPRASHKWRSAVWLVAGSPGMTGAAALAAHAALRTGAGYARVSSPGGLPGSGVPLEAVSTALPAQGWAAEVLVGAERFRAMVVGPGLGAGEATRGEVAELVERCPVPLVVDGDGLVAIDIGRTRLRPDVVLTPHDGEYAGLVGHPPGSDRLGAARDLARAGGATVVLKGPTTVVASPDGGVLLATAGDARLATAGTGDVLSGIMAALLARGLKPLRAAAAAAHLHGQAARLGSQRGLVAGDLAELVPLALDHLDA